MGNLKSYIDVGYLQSFWARVKNIITSSKYTLNEKSQTVKEAIDDLGTSKQDNITAGYGITKSGNQISAEVEYQMGQGCDDAARVILGGDWRLPTIQECYELIDCTTRSTITIGGVAGIECVSKINGASIFFPFTGYMFGTSNDNPNDRVVVWTSELNTYKEDPSGYGNAENLDMFDGVAYVGDSPHYIGLQIRPVSKTEGVDMSFPSGTKWAPSNLKLSGLAFSPHNKGDFFSFAETMPKSDYSASTYKYGLPSTKYYPEGGKTIISLDGSDGSTYITSHGDELQKKLLPGENIVIHDDQISAVIPGQAEAEVLVEMYGGCITISDLEDLSTMTMPTGKFYSVYGSESGGIYAGGFEYEGKQISAGTFFKWNGERWIYDYDELLVSFKSNYLYSREWGAARQSWPSDTWTLLWEWTSNHAGSANKGKTGVGFELQSIGSDRHVGYSTKFIVDSRDGSGYRYINCDYLVPQKVSVSDNYFGSESLDDLSTFVRVTYDSSTATYRLYVRVWEDMNGLAGVNLLHPMWNIDEADFAEPISEDYIRKPWSEIARGTQITDINYGIGGGGGAPAEHTHKSSEITSMDGYSKPSSTSAITTTDTLNSAIGKLEKAIDGKTSNTGTVTSVSVKMNGSSKGTITTSGTIDLGTVLTSFTEADPIFKASAAYGISAADITNWNGKTSNTGTVTSVAVKMNGSTKGTITTSGTIDLGTVLTSYTETDPVFAASPAYGITAADIANWNSKGSGSGTVTQVKVGTTAYNPTDGVISLPAYPSVSYPVTSVAGKTGAVTLAKGDVGLGNVGNFKAVSTVASQGLTDTEKSNARANIGAGTSNLTIGTTASTAAAGNHNHDGTYLKSYTETDPVFKASAAYNITSTDITNWNSKVNRKTFTSDTNGGTTQTNKWREIAYFTSSATGVWSNVSVFDVHDKIGYTGCWSGLLICNIRLNNATSAPTHINIYSDNPVLAGVFKLAYNKSTKRCSIFAKVDDAWNGYVIDQLSDDCPYLQGNKTMVAEPTTGGDLTVVSCVAYTASSNHTHSYLPLSGGTMTGTISRIGSGTLFETHEHAQSANAWYCDGYKIDTSFTGTGDENKLSIFSSVGSKAGDPVNWVERFIITGTNNIVLKNRLTVDETRSGAASVINYKQNGTSWGYMGFSAADTPSVYLTDGTKKNISLEGHTHSEYANATEAFLKKGIVNNTTDWNTLIEPGTYKVQCAGWGAAATYHSPNGYSATQYSYGLLNVFVSNVSDEKRIIQIYYPHGGPTATDRKILFRMHNSNDMSAYWSAWAPIYENTWRGIQNNLTSTSTTDSLSAAQGKALNDKFGSYVAKAGDTMTGGLIGTTAEMKGIAANREGTQTGAGGISLYRGCTDAEIRAYGLAIRGTWEGGTHGYVTGDCATYSYVSSGAGVYNRGWVWQAVVNNARTNVASIDQSGNLCVNGGVSVGCTGTAKAAQIKYNSSTQALEFVFA